MVNNEKGISLIPVMLIVALLAMSSMAMLKKSENGFKEEVSYEDSLEATIYAESGINWLIWQLRNDAEIDGLPPERTNGAVVGVIGDMSELKLDPRTPGPTSINSAVAGYNYGQLRYFDNRPIADRAYYFDPRAPMKPSVMNMVPPEHIVVNVKSNSGDFYLDTTPSGAPVPVSLANAPKGDGVVLWMTAAVPLAMPTLSDITGAQIIDPNGKPYVSDQDIHLDWPNSSCTGQDTHNPRRPEVGCVNGKNISQYALVVYSIGYVKGKPMKMIREQIGVINNSMF